MALVACVDADGKLTNVQPIGADPKNFDADSTETYGVGAFLLAGSEVYRMAVLEVLKFPNVEIAGITNSNQGPIVFNQVPITSIIPVLAHLANIKVELDPKIGYGQSNENGVVKPEPSVTVFWTHLSYFQALQMIVTNCGLQLTRDASDDAYQIIQVANSKTSPFISSPAVIKITNPSNFRRDCETVELDEDLLLQLRLGVAKTSGIRDQDKWWTIMDGASSRVLDSQLYTDESTTNSFSKLTSRRVRRGRFTFWTLPL
jgi:hypothetical protein